MNSGQDFVALQLLLKQYCLRTVEGNVIVPGGIDFQCIQAIVFLSSYYQQDWAKTKAAIAFLDSKGLWETWRADGGEKADFFIGHWLLVDNRNISGVLQNGGSGVFTNVVTIFDLDKMDRQVNLSDAFSPESAGNFLRAPESTYWPPIGIAVTPSVFLVSGWRFLQVLSSGQIGSFNQGNGGVELSPASAWGRSSDGSRLFSALPEDSLQIDQANATITPHRQFLKTPILDSLANDKHVDALLKIYEGFHDPYHFRERGFMEVKAFAVRTNDFDFLQKIYEPLWGDANNWIPDPIKDINEFNAFYNPLCDCIRQGNKALLGFFLEKTPAYATMPVFPSPLSLAVQNDDTEMCTMLIAAGANPTTQIWDGGLPVNVLSFAKSQSMKEYLKSVGVPLVIQVRGKTNLNGYVWDDNVRFRTGPSAQSAIIRAFKKNEQLSLVGISAPTEIINGQTGHWLWVMDSSKNIGWMWGYFFRLARND